MSIPHIIGNVLTSNAIYVLYLGSFYSLAINDKEPIVNQLQGKFAYKADVIFTANGDLYKCHSEHVEYYTPIIRTFIRSGCQAREHFEGRGFLLARMEEVESIINRYEKIKRPTLSISTTV